ncbi:hypothetical protein MAJ_11470, partial [Metarhizium majus ARSEF 297]
MRQMMSNEFKLDGTRAWGALYDLLYAMGCFVFSFVHFIQSSKDAPSVILTAGIMGGVSSVVQGISTGVRTIAICDKEPESKAIPSGAMSSGYVLHAVLKGAEARLKPFEHAGQLPAAGSI